MRYLDLAERLRARIAVSAFGPGGALPSEAELGREHGASRVTVRRALEVLRAEGLVTSRRGAGWFVALDPVRQPLGRVTTVEAALEAAGVRPERRVFEFGFEPAGPVVAGALGVDPGADVLRVGRLNLADGEPFALVTVWVPGDLGAPLSRAEVEDSPLYDLLPLRGVALGAAHQTITADVATGDVARLLGVPAGSPLLVCHRATRDRDGRVVLWSEHRYPARRTAFEIEFPAASVAFTEAPTAGASHA